MQSISRDELKQILEDIFEERSKMDSIEHAEQHEWLRTRIQAEKDRQEFYREGVKIFLQYSIPAIAAAVWLWAKGHINW
jgi:hypothetical protein